MPSHIPWESGELQRLVADPSSRIFRESKRLSLVLQPYHLQDLKSSVNDILLSSMDRFDSSFEGIMLNYEHLKIVSNSGNVAAETSGVVLDVTAEFHIFRPAIGCILNGVVNKRSQDHVGVLLYRRFNVACPRPGSEEKSLKWLGNQVKMHQEVTFKLQEMSFGGRLPYFRGKLLSCGKLSDVAGDERQKHSQKSKKSKKDLKEHEDNSSSIQVEKLLKSKIGGVSEGDAKKGKMEACGTLPHDAVLSPPKPKKKRVSIASVDEVDFFPKMSVTESFLAKTVLPDQFSSPMANSTYFDLGKSLSSQKTPKDKVEKNRNKSGCLSNIREESYNINKSAPAGTLGSVQEGLVKDSSTKKKKKSKAVGDSMTTHAITETSLSKLEEVGAREKSEEKEEKKKKSKKHDKKDISDVSSIKSGSSLCVKNFVNSSKQASQLVPGILSVHDNLPEQAELSLKKAKKSKHSDKLVSSPSLSSLKWKDKSPDQGKGTHTNSSMPSELCDTPKNKRKTRETHEDDIDLKEKPKKIKKKSLDEVRAPQLEVSPDAQFQISKHKQLIDYFSAKNAASGIGFLEPSSSKSENKRQPKNVPMQNMGEDHLNEMSKTKSKPETGLHHESPGKLSKKKSKTKPDASETNKQLLASMKQNLDTNAENVLSHKKLKKNINSPQWPSEKDTLSSHLQMSVEQLATANQILASPPRSLFKSLAMEGRKTPKKDSGNTSNESLSDTVLDDLIPPGQRIKSASQQSAAYARETPPIKFFPRNSMAGIQYGIKSNSKVSPMLFGDIKGDIPAPLMSSASDSESDASNRSEARVVTNSVKVNPVRSVQHDDSDSSSGSDSEPSSQSKKPSFSSVAKTAVAKKKVSVGIEIPSQRDRGDASPKSCNMPSIRSSSKLVLPSGSLKHLKAASPSSSGSDSEVEQEQTGLVSSHSTLKSDHRFPHATASKGFSSPLSGSKLGSVTPKKTIVTGVQSDSSSSSDEEDAGSSVGQERNKCSETSSEDGSLIESRQLSHSNKFLQSMGIIQSPLKAAMLPEQHLPDSDSDSSSSETQQKVRIGEPSKQPTGRKATKKKDLPVKSSTQKSVSFAPKGKRNVKSSVQISEKEGSVMPRKDKKGEVSSDSKMKSQLVQKSKTATKSLPSKSTPTPVKRLTDVPVSRASDDSDLEIMHAAALAMEEPKRDTPPKKLARSKKVGNPLSDLEAIHAVTIALEDQKKNSPPKKQGRSRKVDAPTEKKPRAKRAPAKASKSTAKNAKAGTMETTAPVMKPEVALVAPKSATAKVVKKTAEVQNDSSSDSDSGPEDRNTTLSLEAHRQEVEALQQQAETKTTQRPKIIKNTVKKERKTAPKTATLAQEKKITKVTKKSKAKESSDDLSDIIQRLMEKAKVVNLSRK